MSTNNNLTLYKNSAKTYLVYLHVEFGMLPVTILNILTFYWSTETLRHAYEELVRAGYLIQKRATNLKLTYASQKGFNAYNDYLLKQNESTYLEYPSPEYELRKAESLALNNEVAVFFHLLEYRSQHNIKYCQRSKVRKDLISESTRADDKFKYSMYKGILKYINDGTQSGAVVYNFGNSNRNERADAIENIQSYIDKRCYGIPLFIFGYKDSVPISIVDYSIKMREKSAAEIAGMKNNVHFHLGSNYVTYYFPLAADSLTILSQWSSQTEWKENCSKIKDKWYKHTGSYQLIDCNLSNLQKLAANPLRPLNILLHENQVNIVNTILADVPNPEMINLSPLSPSEFASLMNASILGQELNVPDHTQALVPTAQEKKKGLKKPPQKRQWKPKKIKPIKTFVQP